MDISITFGPQGRQGPTHSTTLMQSSTISEQPWGSILLDCITDLLKMQGIEYMCAEIHRLSEFMHILVISLEYRATSVIELSFEEMIRVHDQPIVVTSDQSRLPFLVF